AGRVHKLLAEVGVTIEVGTPIIEIDTDPDAEPLDSEGGSAFAGGSAANGHDAAAVGAESTGVEAGSGAGTPAAGGARGASLGDALAAGGVRPLVARLSAEARPARLARAAGASAASAAAAAPHCTTPAEPMARARAVGYGSGGEDSVPRAPLATP